MSRGMRFLPTLAFNPDGEARSLREKINKQQEVAVGRRQRESCALLMLFVPPTPHFILALNPAPTCGNLYL